MARKDNGFSFGTVGSISEEYTDATRRDLPKLELAPDFKAPERPLSFNPYDRPVAKKPAPIEGEKKVRTDLRQLSEWIKLKKQVEAANGQGGTPATPTAVQPPGTKPRR